MGFKLPQEVVLSVQLCLRYRRFYNDQCFKAWPYQGDIGRPRTPHEPTYASTTIIVLVEVHEILSTYKALIMWLVSAVWLMCDKPENLWGKIDQWQKDLPCTQIALGSGWYQTYKKLCPTHIFLPKNMFLFKSWQSILFIAMVGAAATTSMPLVPQALPSIPLSNMPGSLTGWSCYQRLPSICPKTLCSLLNRFWQCAIWWLTQWC